MIRVAENLAQEDYHLGVNNPATNNIGRTTISPRHIILKQVDGTQSVSVYSTKLVSVPKDMNMYFSLDVKVNMDYKVRIDTSGFFGQPVELKKDEWTRIYEVVPTGAYESMRYPVPSTDDVPESGGLILEVRNPMISILPHDIYTPPHTALTPEQIALMKYGEFEEAKQI